MITELDHGGAERALVRIVTGLDRSLWEPQVISLNDSELIRQWLSIVPPDFALVRLRLR